MNKRLIGQLIIIFLATSSLGIFTAMDLLQEDVHVSIVTDNPQDVENSVGLFVWILVFTGFLLLLILFVRKSWLYWVFKMLESMAILGASFFVFSAFIASSIALFLAFGLVGIRILFRHNIWLRNVSSVLATAGAGAVLGVSLGVFPVLVFLVLLGIYDYIAVFKTKHMITLAKPITKMNLSFTYALPTKNHKFELGTGDLVMPLIFGISVLNESQSMGTPYPLFIIPTILVLTGSLLALLWTLDYAEQRKGKPLPALPLQVFTMLIFYALAKLTGF